MMEGHEMMAPTEKTTLQLATTTRKSNSFADDSLDFGIGTQTAASAKVASVYRVNRPKEFLTAQSGTPQYTYPHNLVPYLSTIEKINNNRNEKITEQSTRRNSLGESDENNVYTGSMVIKVYPDGTPVRGLSTLLPQDDDLHHYKFLKVKVPHL